MNPKEKAKLLIYDFWNITGNFHLSKKCALTSVDEIYLALPIDYQDDIWTYWKEVKKEIEAL
jgi:hypothetical protein